MPSLQATLTTYTAILRDLADWKPTIDSKVDGLQVPVNDLCGKVESMAAEQQAFITTDHVFDVEHVEMKKSDAAHLASPSSEATSGPIGHHSAPLHRRSGFGVVSTLQPPLVTGIPPGLNFNTIPSKPLHVSNSGFTGLHHQLINAMPQLEFPRFDGSNPKMWKNHCESFFRIIPDPEEAWSKLATLHFVGSAAFWFQSLCLTAHSLRWSELCRAVCYRFELDQNNQILRSFFHASQTSSVAEYVEQFDALVHQLKAYDPNLPDAILNGNC